MCILAIIDTILLDAPTVLVTLWSLEQRRKSTSFMNNFSFDTSKFELGKLCIRKHEWKNTGKSLRFIYDRDCPDCRKIRQREGGLSSEAQFWLKVQKTDTCWLWIGHKDQQGYGKTSIRGKRILAHRYSYELHYEAIPSGLYVCHKCDVPNCIRPDHLFLGTNLENLADKFAKNRQAKGEKK